MRSFRSRGGAVLVLTGALLLTACGGAPAGDDGADAATEAASDSLLPPAEGSVTYPLTLETSKGDIVIDERPERIVTSGWGIEIAAALGVTPVGAPETAEMLPWAFEAMPGEVEEVWPVADAELPAEIVASLDPDLVVATDTAPANYDQLSNVAPVLAPPVSADDDATWQEQLLLLGEALDLTERAEQVIADHDAHFEQIRTDNPEFHDLSISYLLYWGGEWGGTYANAPGTPSGDFLSAIGFQPSPDAAIFTDDPEMTLSEELLGEFQADVLLVGDYTRGASEEFRAFFDDSLIQRTPAAENGRLIEFIESTLSDGILSSGGVDYEFEGHFGWAVSSGPLGAERVADVLVPILKEGIAASGQ